MTDPRSDQFAIIQWFLFVIIQWKPWRQPGRAFHEIHRNITNETREAPQLQPVKKPGQGQAVKGKAWQAASKGQERAIKGLRYFRIVGGRGGPKRHVLKHRNILAGGFQSGTNVTTWQVPRRNLEGAWTEPGRLALDI